VPPEASREKEQVQTSTEALNAWDFEVLADVFHPELEHRSVFAAVEGEVYLGIEGQRRRWENVHATWDDFRIAVAEVHDVDKERVVVVLRLTGKAKVSGVPLDTLLGQVRPRVFLSQVRANHRPPIGACADIAQVDDGATTPSSVT
jgi:hypothetical protein